MNIVLITGMSGAGKTTALKTLEDLGFDAVDNIPLPIISLLLQSYSKLETPKIAIGIDIRTRDFNAKILADKIIPEIRSKNINSCILYLDANDDVLIRRFAETRRRHPLAHDRAVIDGIKKERKILENLREVADLVIDTSEFSIKELANWIRHNFADNSSGAVRLLIRSFSFKKGVPRDADMVFDMRFLKNPYYIPALKNLSGRDKLVQDYIGAHPAFQDFMRHLNSMLSAIIPHYLAEGKTYITIAIGCTGGRHRSVYTAEHLYAHCACQGYNCHLNHRDL